MRFRIYPTVLLITCLSASAFAASPADHWPTWRGPTSDGIAPKGNPPITWSETENIKWKIEIPGQSDSTPIVWGNKMFIQTAVATGQEPPPPEETAGERRRRRGARGGAGVWGRVVAH